MRINFTSLVEKAKKLIKMGFVHVFGASVLNKVMTLAANMLIVRLLSKSEYGYYSYAYNIITIVLIVSDIGTRMARFQYCCETEDIRERERITSFLVKVGALTNLICGVLTFLYATFLPLAIEGGRMALQLLSFFMIFQFFYDQQCYNFRIAKDNIHYAKLTNINTLCYLFFFCSGAYFGGLVGAISGRYLAFIVPITVGIIWSRKYIKRSDDQTDTPLLKDKKDAMIQYGLLIMLTNCVSSVLHYFDTFLVGLIISNETILADYKVATLIPTALNFIPLSCITFIYPYFVQHIDNYEWIMKKAKAVQLGMFFPSVLISVFGVIFAEKIVGIVFGENYISAVPVFRVLMTTFFLAATFRIIYGNILSMLHLVKINFIISTIECVVNIIADVILIKHFGSIGAAYATMIITVISSIMSGCYFYYYIRKKKKDSSLVVS